MTTSVTTSAATAARAATGQAICPACGLGFTRVRRQAYCTPACRQAAWRARQGYPAATVPTMPAPAGKTRRDVTVYQCTECDERYLGVQWCPDCQRPCTRVGLGGLCRECGEPTTVDELLGVDDDQHIPGKIR